VGQDFAEAVERDARVFAALLANPQHHIGKRFNKSDFDLGERTGGKKWQI
jgi:hypothetical protein